VPEATALEHRWLPLRINGATLEIACAVTPSRADLDALQESSGRLPITFLVEPARLDAAIARAYRHGGDERGKPLGVYLVDRGFIERDALDRHLATRDPFGRRLFERLVDDDCLSPAVVATIVTEYFALPVAPLPAHLGTLSAEAHAKIAEILNMHPGLAIGLNAGTPALFAAVPMEGFVISAIADALGSHATFAIAPLDAVRVLRPLAEKAVLAT
jgi:hypothetical protein